MSEEIRNEELQNEEMTAEEEKTQEASSKKEKLKDIKKENAALTSKCEELEEKLSSLSDEIQIPSKSIVQRMDENGISLECRIACVENIAILQELEFVE